jgi:DNA-binding CsgD family transcriptional regulator
MFKILVYLIFIISVALSAIGIILSSRLRNKYRSDIFSALLYFQVFICTFGFYGIWGQVVIKSLLSEFVSSVVLSRLSDIAILLGIPFLVFAWLMLIKFSGSLSDRKGNRWFVLWFLLINFSILVTLGYFTTRSGSFNTNRVIKEYYIAMNLIYFFIAAYLIHFPWRGKPIIHDHDRRIVAPSLFLIMILQCVPLFFYTTQNWVGVIFIFAFFLGNIFLPVYFSYGTLLSAFGDEPGNSIPYEEFCTRFDISPRESDVIREICNGLSNKEISDTLFISLQTVKDHTHHIYIKTNVKSRVQLINLVKELMN